LPKNVDNPNFIRSEIDEIMSVSCYYEKVKNFKGINGTNVSNKKYRLSIDKRNNVLPTEKLSDGFENISKTWFIGGTGKKPRNCKPFFPKSFCDHCGQIYLISGTCTNPKCPDCYSRWRYRRTEAAVGRLESYRIENKLRLGHFMVSVPPAMYNNLKSPYAISRLMKYRIYRFLKIKKVYGGWIVFHPFRIYDDKKKELYDFFKLHEDLMEGEFALWKCLSNLSNWRDFVYFSPHFHVIAPYAHSDPAAVDDDFVFKRIGDLHQTEDVVKCIMYLLSHTGLHSTSTHHNIKWYGVLSTARWCLRRASSKVQAYVVWKINHVLQQFADKEGYNHRICAVCGGSLVSIKDVHQYLYRFNHNTQHRLKYAFNWCVGNIPPPDGKTLLDLISSNNGEDRKFESAVVLRDKRKRSEFRSKKHRLISDKKKYRLLREKYCNGLIK
jgi:hypothetical protein